MSKPGLMIMIGHGDEAGANGSEMCNVIYPPDNAFKDAQDGDEVTFQAKGKLIEHDGHRFVMVSDVDGQPVQELDQQEKEPTQEELGQQADQSRENLKSMLAQRGDKNQYM